MVQLVNKEVYKEPQDGSIGTYVYRCVFEDGSGGLVLRGQICCPDIRMKCVRYLQLRTDVIDKLQEQDAKFLNEELLAASENNKYENVIKSYTLQDDQMEVGVPLGALVNPPPKVALGPRMNFRSFAVSNSVKLEKPAALEPRGKALAGLKCPRLEHSQGTGASECSEIVHDERWKWWWKGTKEKWLWWDGKWWWKGTDGKWWTEESDGTWYTWTPTGRHKRLKT